MDDLLQRVPMSSLSTKKVPFMIEVPVAEECAPFLVTGTKQWLWVHSIRQVDATRSGVLRSAVRLGPLSPTFFIDVAFEVAKMGKERKWGNRFPLTPKGLTKALEYVRSYGIEKLEILVSPKDEMETPKGVTRSSVPWMPSGRAVVVPEDRAYLGMVGTLGKSHWTAVVHNPSRGMAVLGAW